MKITITLPTETAIGLRRLAAEQGIELEAAAAIALKEFLTMGGWIEVDEKDKEGEVEGEA